MENGSSVEIHYLERVDSTQRYLLDGLKRGEFSPPICVVAITQFEGKGSRGNSWIGEEGNLFLSLAISRSDLPSDLKLESTSIYFSFLMKELLNSLGSSVWLKWPNDFYLEDKKIGGTITNLIGNTVVCGMGLNLRHAPELFGILDIDISSHDITEKYIKLFKKLPEWKQIFSKFELEFERSRSFFTHYQEEKIALQNAVLLEDGSLECDGQRIFSLR